MKAKLGYWFDAWTTKSTDILEVLNNSGFPFSAYGITEPTTTITKALAYLKTKIHKVFQCYLLNENGVIADTEEIDEGINDEYTLYGYDLKNIIYHNVNELVLAFNAMTKFTPKDSESYSCELAQPLRDTVISKNVSGQNNAQLIDSATNYLAFDVKYVNIEDEFLQYVSRYGVNNIWKDGK